VAAAADGRVLAGTAAGCLVSADGGGTWRLENDGLTHLDVYALAPVPRGGLLAGTNGGGVFRAADAGRPRWTPMNDGLPDRVIHDVVVLPDSRVVAATSNLAEGYKGGSVYEWRDGAWVPVAPGLPDAAIYGLAVDRAGGVYAAVRGARVFRLEPQGDEWRDVSPGLVGAKGYGIAVTATGSVLLGTSDGAWRSGDGGESWKPSPDGLSSSTAYSFAGDDRAVYTGTTAGVHRSLDDGVTWER
jgi:hypothetical protein